VDASADSESQTGSRGPWLQTLEALFPFRLNSVQIHDGSIHFRSYKKRKPVDVYLSQSGTCGPMEYLATLSISTIFEMA
jgi:hypothetical protein